MTRPSFASLKTFALDRSFSEETSSALLLLSTMRLRCAFRSPCAGRLPMSPPDAPLLFLVFSVLTPFFGAAVMPFFFIWGFAWRAADVEKQATRGCRSRTAADECAVASRDSCEKLRRQL